MVIAIKTIFILAILAALCLATSGCTTAKPALTVEGINDTDRLGLTTGCYSTISGVVRNNGNATANDVTVNCSTTQDGAIIGTESKSIGSASQGTERSFSMDVDTDCLKGEVTYKCSADCGNC